MTKTEIERWLVMCGHAINANNGRCGIVEAALCTATTVGVQILADMDEREKLEAQEEHSKHAPRFN